MTVQTLPDGLCLIRLPSDIDLYRTAAIKTVFNRLRGTGANRFILDFDQTQYIDSSGIGLLLYLHTSVEHRNMRIRFVNMKGGVLRVIELTRMTRIFPISGTLDEAVRDLAQETEERSASIRQMIVDGGHPFFSPEGLTIHAFRIGLERVRRLSALIAQKAPTGLREWNILEQQISELIKNAVKHGNRCDPDKTVRIAYEFRPDSARLVVEDEGEGFADLERWNEFYKTKQKLYHGQEYDKLMDYLTFRTERSTDLDGGNALFAAIEYWNQGVVFNEKRNAIAVKRIH